MTPVPRWQKVTALILFVVVLASTLAFHSRASADFWPLDSSRVGPNLVASVVQWILVLIAAALIWPPTRHAIERFTVRHAESLKAHVSADNALIHHRLDHLHTKIDAVHSHLGIGVPMFDLSTLEARFHSVESTVEGDLHSKIGEVVVAAAKDLIGLLPDGAEVESILAKLDAVAAEAHAVADAVVAPVPPVPSSQPETPVSDPAAPVEAQPAPDPTPAPTEAAPAPETTAGQDRPV